jgi:hypothetical protein
LQPLINKFCGIVHTVEGLNQSGASPEDQLNRALCLYAICDATTFSLKAPSGICAAVITITNKVQRKRELEAQVASHHHQINSH